MLPDAAVEVLAGRYKTRLLEVIGHTSGQITGIWDAMPTHDRDDIGDLQDRAVPALRAGRNAVVTLSAGFYATLAGTRAPKVDPTRLGAYFDAEMPFTAYWHALKVGREKDDALAAGGAAFEAATSRFLVSNARRTGDPVIAASGRDVDHWRRLADAGDCDWCHARALEIYPTAEATDFGHDRCLCLAQPKFTTTQEVPAT
jgi:hypothetical protein